MYKTKSSLLGKIMSGVLAAAMAMSMSAVSAFAAGNVETGNYEVDATLSCYVNAMGGVEFSDGYGLLSSSTVKVENDGTANITLNLGKTSGLSIFGVPCTAFIGVDETPGYYVNGSVTKEGVQYTLSEDKVANANTQVNYITSLTVPVDVNTSEYTMWLYIDSNVMGCQLGDGSGKGASNTPGAQTAHTAKLTIDWSSIKAASDEEPAADKSSNQTANVEYTVAGGYEVEIPSVISVDATTNQGVYSVTAQNFVIDDGAYVTVTADKDGSLTNGSATLAFTNELESGRLTKTGDTLNGTVEVTDTATNPGKYAGTINFTINYYSGN